MLEGLTLMMVGAVSSFLFILVRGAGGLGLEGFYRFFPRRQAADLIIRQGEARIGEK